MNDPDEGVEMPVLRNEQEVRVLGQGHRQMVYALHRYPPKRGLPLDAPSLVALPVVIDGRAKPEVDVLEPGTCVAVQGFPGRCFEVQLPGRFDGDNCRLLEVATIDLDDTVDPRDAAEPHSVYDHPGWAEDAMLDYEMEDRLSGGGGEID